jgi:hypothetical protein
VSSGRSFTTIAGSNKLANDPTLDAADRQTVKHHAEDCIGLGNKVLEILKAGDTKVRAQP